MIYYSYTKISEPGPNGTTITALLPEVDGQRIGNELATINGVTYLSLPDDALLPEQPTDIILTPFVLTDALRAELKSTNSICRLIDQQIRAKIRERYDAEDEMYLTRISVGALMGAYVFQAGEQEAVIEYGAYVEGVRAWAREQRAELGL